MTGRSVAIVTGAAGQLGSQMVLALSAAGHRVVAFDRSADGLARAGDAWSHQGRPDIETVQVDQTSSAAVGAAVQDVLLRHGRLDGLVANAGYAKYGGVLEMEPATWDRHVAVNLSGTFYTLQAAGRAMASLRSGGWITVISSNLAVAHADQVSAYCVTKSALVTLAKSAAAELGVHRIRVNAVLPGVVETAMTTAMLREPDVREGLLAKTPLGRLGGPKDIASAVCFLASEAADWVTGAALLVDGGQSIYGQPAWICQDRSIPHEPAWVDGYSGALADRNGRN
jgi:NAD(P)-dependent dehydrogenase (short-subunit alcohol dehydrogenase family)